MGRMRALWLRVRGLLGKPADVDAELLSHLQLHIDDGVRAGMTEEEARRVALVKLGGVEQTRQAYRERAGLPWLENLWRDVVFAVRVLKNKPGFTVIAVLTLALGIGANTALFSVVDGVLLHPLPYPHPEELLKVDASKPNFPEGSIAYPNFRDWQRENTTLEALAVSRGTGYNMTGLGDAEEIRAELVSSDFFPLLGVKPVLGRLFAPGEDEIGRAQIAMISEGFWKRKFGLRPDVVSKVMTLDGWDYTIVGVIPASFRLAVGSFRPADIYVPIGQFQNPALNDRGSGLGLHGIARMKPGVSLKQAQDDLARVSLHLAQEFPADDKDTTARLVPLNEALVRDVRPLLLVLLGAVGFVLLIACVNVANLFLARSSARVREFAVRSALGAGHVRLVRQLLTESTLISLAGGALGLLIAGLGTRTIVQLMPQGMPRADEIHMSLPVLAFTLVISLGSGLLFGLAPAWKLLRRNLFPTLREGGRGAAGSSKSRAQDRLVVLQVAMALVLLAGAGLLIRSLAKLSSVDPGFRPHGVLTFGMQPPPSIGNAPTDEQRAYLREAEHRIEQVPGITAASLSWAALPMMSDDELLFWLDGEAKPANFSAMRMSIRYIVGPGYRKTMGIPLLRGRFLEPGDDDRSQRVLVVDDVFAKKFFGTEDVVGKVVHIDNMDDPSVIVGVVGHVNQWGLDVDSSHSLRAESYESLLQLPKDQLGLAADGVDVVVRSSGDEASTFKAVHDGLAQMDHEQVVYNPQSMESVISDTLAGQRFTMILLSAFAGMALLLASIGIYGVISYLVGERAREIGVRMALGADRGSVLRWVLSRGGKLAGIGAAVGLGAALALTLVMTRASSLSSLLFGVKAYDPLTLLSVTALLMGVTLAACVVPALRATRIEPVEVLRAE